MAVQSKPFLKVLAVACVAVASFGCGGDDAPASERAFCNVLAEQDVLDDLDPMVAEDRDEIEAYLAEMAGAAPAEMRDDVRAIEEAYEAMVAQDEELLSDPDFQSRVLEATENLDSYLAANCESSAGSDPVDTVDPSDTTTGPEASDPVDTTTSPDTTSPDTTSSAETLPATDPTLPEVDVDDAQPVVVTDSGVGVFTAFDEPRGTWSATITNPNDGVVAEFIEVQATFKDTSGVVIDTGTDYLDALLPGETRAVGSDYLDTDPADIATVDVVASTRNFRVAGPDDVPALTVEPSVLERSPDGLRVVAEVTSTDDQVQTNPSVVVVVRDAKDRIIGGLTGYVGFVPPGGSVGVEARTSLVFPRDVEIEMYLDYALDPWIEGVGLLEVPESGFTVTGTGETAQGTWAALVENPDTTRAASFVQVVATFRDADGFVVDVDSGSISAIGPGAQSAAASEWMYGMSSRAGSVEVVALASSWVDDPVAGAVTATGVKVRPQQYGGVDVTGELVSTFDRKVESLNVVVVFRAPNGAILGGTGSYVDFVPAAGSVGFSISSSFEHPRNATAEVWPGYGDAYD